MKEKEHERAVKQFLKSKGEKEDPQGKSVYRGRGWGKSKKNSMNRIFG